MQASTDADASRRRAGLLTDAASDGDRGRDAARRVLVSVSVCAGEQWLQCCHMSAARALVRRQTGGKEAQREPRQAGRLQRSRAPERGVPIECYARLNHSSACKSLSPRLNASTLVNTNQSSKNGRRGEAGRSRFFKQGAQRSHTQLMVEPGASRRIRSSPREQRCQPACICCASSCCASFPPLPRAQTPDSTLLCSCTAQADTLRVTRS